MMERVEDEYTHLQGNVYAIKHSVLDSSDDEDYGILKVRSVTGGTSVSMKPTGAPLIFEGEARMVDPDEMLWIPVRMESTPVHRPEDVQLALPSDCAALEAVPGIWPTGESEGMICICNLSELPVALETGAIAAAILPGACSTSVCDKCGKTDTLADILTQDSKRCGACNAGIIKRQSDCRHCGTKDPAVLSYTGCKDCKPEQEMPATAKEPPLQVRPAGEVLNPGATAKRTSRYAGAQAVLSAATLR